MAIAMEVRDTEVVAKATRRRFTAEYKRKVLQEAERAKAPGEIGALLRREGLYSSHLTSWRAARERGEAVGLAAKRRGPKPKPRDERDRRISELERDLARTRKQLERAEAVIEVQKKLSLLLGVERPDPNETP
jgi:transposase-like protein